jgi:orotate phosphoribosyltransferase
MGADPVAYAIARASAELPPIIDGFSVRKAAKEHGTKQRVEGNFDRGIQVVVVEDVITSGSSALQAIEAIRAEGGNPLGVVAVVDRLQGGAEAITKAAGLDVVSMTTVRDFGIQPT